MGIISFTANKSITMISARSLLFAAFVAMFALTMAAPAAEPAAEAEAEPAYYHSVQQNGPHQTYYRGYNSPSGQHYRGNGYNYQGYNGFNGYQGYNQYNGFNNGFSNQFNNRFQAQGW